ncbi:unnamed protein product [Amoebophrya sp. A25]|nr:unnamed protein product [Amoebophrya sp. A25]|eukprot:GSA25T00016550001.1
MQQVTSWSSTSSSCRHMLAPRLQLRHFSSATSKRNFYQRLDEKHLAEQLAAISRTASDYAREEEGDQPSRAGSSTRSSASTSSSSKGLDDLGVPANLHRMPDALEAHSRDFDVREKLRACDSIPFESMRQEGLPRYQDLTHAERVMVQADYKRKKMLDRKVMWLKMNQVLDPKRAARREMRLQMEEEKARKTLIMSGDSSQPMRNRDGVSIDMTPEQLAAEREALAEQQEAEAAEKLRRKEADPEGYPLSLLSEHHERMEAKNAARVEMEMRRDELESRKRMRVRALKLKNAQILKQKTPPLGQAATDPILRHIEKRKTRLNQLLTGHLEAFLTNNSSQILHSFLEGAQVTVLRVTARNPKGVHEVHYQLSQVPEQRSIQWVRERLDTLAPKLRSQIAVKLQLGYTPELRFVHHAFGIPQSNRGRLFRIAKSLREARAAGSLDSWTRTMNWS